MKSNLLSAALLSTTVLSGCVTNDLDGELDDVPDADWSAGKADGSSQWVVSASTVEALGGDLSSLTPPCRTADSGHDCAFYLASGSALGDYGPLGAYGPLGTLGPLGDNAWNASSWMGAMGDWSKWSREMIGVGGALSKDGPLGPSGPLSDAAYFETLPAINDWAKQLQAGGMFTSLGPPRPPRPPRAPRRPRADWRAWLHAGRSRSLHEGPHGRAHDPPVVVDRVVRAR